MDRLFSTLSKHIIEEERKHPSATGEFTNLMTDIAVASKVIAAKVNKAGILNILGVTGKVNIQGEEVKKLDEYANDIFKKVLEIGGYTCILASEEDEEALILKQATGKYAVVFDPLDGSSNIDANVSIGTIFGIYKKSSKEDHCSKEDLLQPAKNMVAAGYIIYGSSTMFVYTTGNGVHGFTLDPEIGEFILSHKDIKIPEKSKIYSINEGNYSTWPEGIKKYINKIKQERTHSLRYIGSLVADFHRNLVYGGVFLYPQTSKNPKGKLRLLYEAGPLSYIVKEAGGKGSNGTTDILDIVPNSIHERVPLFIGSKKDVEEIETILKEG